MRADTHYASSALPTNELAGETGPLIPVLPEAKVTAPASMTAPLSQSALATT